MVEEFGIVERSMHGFPGHISVILDTDGKEMLGALKENLLRDNPMVSAIFLSARTWGSCKEAAEWARKNNLRIGLRADEMKLEDVRSALDSGLVEFVRLGVKKEPEIKKKAGIIRNSGIKHEFVFGLDDNDSSKAEEAYLLVSPCDSFVVETHSRLKDETKNSLMELTTKYKSLFLRLYK
jgi:hypothetical protein